MMLRLLLTGSAVLFGTIVLAQDETDSAPPPDNDVPTLPPTRVFADPPTTGSPSSGNRFVPDTGPLSPDVVVTPNRSATPRRRVASSVTVITEDQIRSSGQRTVLEVLRSSPAVDVVQSGGPGRVTSIFIRGAESNHTRVLLDGIPLNDPSSPDRAFDFSTLMVDNIERIEVLRGPQSTLYGSDAIGGVVNIVTKRGDGPAQIRVNTSGGSFDTYRQAGSLSGGTDAFHYSFAGSYLDTNGFSAAAPRLGATERDGYRNGTLSGRMGYTISETIDLDYVFRYIDADTQIDGFGFVPALGFVPQDEIGSATLSESFASRVQLSHLLLDGNVRNRFGYNFVNYNREAIGPFPGFFDGDTSRFDWQSNIALYESRDFQAGLIGGLDYLEEDARTNSFSNRTLRDTGLYAQAEMIVRDNWTTTAGTRWDDYSQAGETSTWRVTSRYDLPKSGTAFHGTIGTGFRAPSLDELFGLVGNPALRPERSRGWDAGVSQSLEDGQVVLDATFFRNDFDDLIEFFFTGAGAFGGELRNIQSALTSGVELYGRVELTECTSATASYTYLHTRNRTTGVALLRRPRNKYAIAVSHRFAQDRAGIRLGFRWVDKRDDFGGFVLDDYSLLNGSWWFQVNDQVRLFGRIDNILDENYEEVFGFATAPLSAYAGVEVRLGGS